MAVIGVGHLGKEHARILSGLPDVELVGVADVSGEQAQTVARNCRTAAFTAYWPLLSQVDAAVIAVPTCFHHAVAGDFLARGIHLLIEKPLASTLAQAEALTALAHQHEAILQVGHIERFNPAFEELRRRPLQPKFIEGRRVGPYTGRSTDIGAVLDMMIHDLDLVLTLVGAPVRSVEAVGASVFGGHEDMVQTLLTFENGCVVSLAASRVSPQPQRRMHVWGPEGFANIDFARRSLTLVQPGDELRAGLDIRKMSPAARAALRDDLYGKHLQTLELDCNRGDQLTRELQDFVRCARDRAAPRVTGEDGCRAIDLATRILERMSAHQWDASSQGPRGPLHLPAAQGQLFQPAEQQSKAA